MNNNIYLDWKLINERKKKICLLHNIISTETLLENKKKLLFSVKYIYFNKNRIIDSYYQPTMIVRRSLCERVDHLIKIFLEEEEKQKKEEKDKEEKDKEDKDKEKINQIIV